MRQPLAADRIFRALCVAVFLVLGAYPHGVSSETPSVAFETRWGVTVTDADKVSILRLGATLSSKRISKVIVASPLPLSVAVATVLYEDEYIDTYVVQTSLRVDKKDPAHWNQQYLDSLSLTDGVWGTKRSALRRVVLRRFRIDGIQVIIPIDDSVSYREVAQLLKAIKDKAIDWETQKVSRIDVGLEDVQTVGRSSFGPVYYIGVTRGDSPPFYSLKAEFDGHKITVRDASMAIP